MLGIAGCNDPGTIGTSPSPTSPPSPTGCSVSAILVPSCGVWWGAAANPLQDESWDEALGAFEDTVDQAVDIAHYYNASPKLFPTSEMIQRAREPGKNRLLLLNWKPEMGRTWAQVAAGDPEVDAAIDAEADYMKSTFGEKFFLAVHHEPEDEVDPRAASGMTAKDFRAMYRYVVLRLRARGVTNAVTVMNYMGTPHWGSQPWFDDLYPGDDVVDWIAEDPYIIGTDPDWSSGFAQAVDRTQSAYPRWPGFYTWATTKHPGKPIMLGEWGVDRRLGKTKRAAVFAGIPSQIAQFPRLKALVYWHAPKRQEVGTTAFTRGEPALDALRSALAAPQMRPRVRPTR